MLTERYKEIMIMLRDKITDPSVFLNMNHVITQLFTEHEAQVMLDAGVDEEEIYKRLPVLKGRSLKDIGYLSLRCHVERRENYLIDCLGQKYFTSTENVDLESVSRAFALATSLFMAKEYIHHLLGRGTLRETIPVKSDYSFTKTLTKLQIAEITFAYPWGE